SHDRQKAIPYNRRMLCKENRAIRVVWVFRWSEEVNGQRRQHKEVIGTTKQFPTEAAANRGGRSVTVSTQREQAIGEPENHGVWGTHQPLHQPGTATPIVCA